MNPTLMTAVEACDRLNSFVRSPSEHDFMWRPKQAIYWLKGSLLNAVMSDGIAQHRRIAVEVKCRSCDGTGKWTSWDYGQTNEACRTCGKTGKHLLHFVETIIDGRFKWHTPVKYGLFCEHPVRLAIESLGKPEIVTDWKPLQEGRPLEPWEVARDLNTLETFIPERPGDRWCDDGGRYNIFKYKLFVGGTAKACFRCGVTGEDVSGLCCSRNNVAWHDWVCKKCNGCFGNMMVWSEPDKKYIVPGGSVFDAVPFPTAMVQHPEIKAWIERHT